MNTPFMTPSWSTVSSLEEIALDGVEAVVADVDYTLVDFGRGHRAAIAALTQAYGDAFAMAIHESFTLTLEAGRRLDDERWEARDRYRALLEAAWAKTPTGQELKHWSRERWMEIASDRLDLCFDANETARARDLYWQSLGREAVVYPDAEKFLKRLRERGLPLVLMTASDSVLRQTDHGFTYDPVFAAGYKRRRLALLPILADEIVVGDPHDKPSEEFFRLVDEAVRAHTQAPYHRVMAVGDSPKSDLVAPVLRGYHGVHIDRA